MTIRKHFALIALGAVAAVAADHAPERLLASDALLADPMSLPDAPGKTSTVFRGEAGVSGFNLHSYLAHHDGKFFAIWSSAKVGEEDPDQFIRYSTSSDGHTWAPSKTVVADPDGPEGPKRWIARGLFVYEGKLSALAALVGSATYRDRGKGVVWADLALMRFTWDGKDWKPAGVFADDCMNNFAPFRIKGLWQMPCRDKNMSMYVAVSDSPASGWKRLELNQDPPFHRLDEPTIYEAADGTEHLIIRDGTRSGKLARSVSKDGGKTWSKPVSTNYPDATSKNFAAKLSNGTYYLINNPNTKGRDPLAISFSKDGWVYDNPLAVRKNAPERRMEGRAKGSRSLQYPHAMEHAGSLWIIYATNKEDIDVTQIKLADLRKTR